MTIQTLFKALVIILPVAAPFNFHMVNPVKSDALYYNNYSVSDTSKKYKLKKYKIFIPPVPAWKSDDSKMVDTIPDSKNRDRKMTDTIAAEPWR